MSFKAGYVNIFGLPNAGKSTLLNALLGEKLVIVSHKVQTTRHRILGILNSDNYQIIFSDTPGIIDPKYKLHQKMMGHVKSALEDADVAILLQDINLPVEDAKAVFEGLKLRVPALLVRNKADLTKSPEDLKEKEAAYEAAFPKLEQITISALNGGHVPALMERIIALLPEGLPFYPEDHISDRPVRFFVAEFIREQIFHLLGEELPYHTAVLVRSYEEKSSLHVIKADIIVSRETQKMIILGKGGSMIKNIGMGARERIEEFVGEKVHLELFVKVRPKWRDNENYLREYGYNG